MSQLWGEGDSSFARKRATGANLAGSVKGGVNLDHFGGVKVDQLVKG